MAVKRSMRVTTLTPLEMEKFFETHPQARQWEDSLYEVIWPATSWVAQEKNGKAWPRMCQERIPIHTKEGYNYAVVEQWHGDQSAFIPVAGARILQHSNAAVANDNNAGPRDWQTNAQTHGAIPNAYPIGAFFRIWIGEENGSNGAKNPPTAASACYVSIEPTDGGSEQIVSSQGNRIVEGQAIFPKYSVAVGSVWTLKAELKNSTKAEVYISQHVVYNWNPGLQGSPTIDWTMPSPIPLELPDTGSATLTANITTPNEEAGFRHKAEFVLLDESGNKRTDSGGVIQCNDGNVFATTVRSLTATYQRSLFSQYPNSRTISGFVRLWTYWSAEAQTTNGVKEDVCYNENGEPVENLFMLELPATSSNIPTMGSLTTSVIRNGFKLTSKYVQNMTGVSIKLASSSAKLNATIKRMWVAYYDGTISSDTVKTADVNVGFVDNGNGSYTFKIDRIRVSGDLKFTVYVEDSRGMISASKTSTIHVEPYSAPQLTSCDLYRADQNGTPNTFGDYAVIRATAYVSPVGNANSLTSIKVAILQYEPNMDWSHATDVTLTPGEDMRLSGILDPTKIYRVRITIKDKAGQSTVRYRVLGTAGYTFHLRQGGNGIGIGEASRTERAVSIADNWDLYVYGQRLMDLLVPIGCVKMYTRVAGQPPVEPSELYPGTAWQRITNRFLMASSLSNDAGQKYITGTTGGSETFTLEPANIPQIPVTHPYGGYAHNYRVEPVNTIRGFGGLEEGEGNTIGQYGGPNFLDGAYANKGNTSPTPVEHLPPFYAVDVWIRTA